MKRMLLDLILLIWAVGATILMLRYKKIAETAVEIGQKLMQTLVDVSGKVAIAHEHINTAIAIDEEIQRQQAFGSEQLNSDRMN